MHTRFMRWARAGEWEQIFADLVAHEKNQYLMIDSTIVRAHQQAAAAAKRGGSDDPALERSRGGLSTKIHLLSDEAGLPVAFRITPGQAAEYGSAVLLLEGQQAEAVIADKGYDSAEIVAKIESLGAVPVIPPRRHHNTPRSYNRELPKQRNRIERCFNRLRRFRRFSTRYCRTLEALRSTTALACTWLRLDLFGYCLGFSTESHPQPVCRGLGEGW